MASDELAMQILATIALIPEGKVASYGQIARMAGLPRHARYVGHVLKHLDADSHVPWHRVVNSKGQIVMLKQNAAGQYLQVQLLNQEGVEVVANQIDLAQFQWQPDLDY